MGRSWVAGHHEISPQLVRWPLAGIDHARNLTELLNTTIQAASRSGLAGFFGSLFLSGRRLGPGDEGAELPVGSGSVATSSESSARMMMAEIMAWCCLCGSEHGRRELFPLLPLTRQGRARLQEFTVSTPWSAAARAEKIQICPWRKSRDGIKTPIAWRRVHRIRNIIAYFNPGRVRPTGLVWESGDSGLRLAQIHLRQIAQSAGGRPHDHCRDRYLASGVSCDGTRPACATGRRRQS